MTDKHAIAAVILAAGKGKRMNMNEANKVTALLNGQPIISHIVTFMENLTLGAVIIVVGHEKESVKEAVQASTVIFVEQTEQLGTGHALHYALDVLPKGITDLFVVYGDDAVFYNAKNQPVMENLFVHHAQNKSAITFLTIEKDDPTGLGRIVRNEAGSVVSIVEEKDATVEQRNIQEINPGCFIFNVDFVKKYLPIVEKSPVTGEYYLTSLIDVALGSGEKVETVRGGKLAWRGVNTPEELIEAEKIHAAI